MNRRRDLPRVFRGESFRTVDGRVAGVSRKRLLALDLVAPFHGVRAAVGTEAPVALLPAFRPGDAYTGPTAAQLWGLPLPRRLHAGRVLHVSSVIPTAPMRRPGVHGTSRTEGAVVELAGIPVLEPIPTWASLGGAMSLADLVAAGDRLVSGTLRTAPLATLDGVRAYLDDRPGTRHVRDLRRALDGMRVGSWSRPESLLRQLIVAAGLPEPELNHPVLLANGRRAVLDLAWLDARIDVEYDGRWHDEGSNPARDAARREELADDGWTSVHVRADELFDTPSLVIARLIRRRAVRGFPSSVVEIARMPRFER